MDDTDKRISAAVRALAAGRGYTLAAVGRGAGISSATFERRLARGGWTAVELVVLAGWFDVPVEDLTSGLGGQVGPR